MKKIALTQRLLINDSYFEVREALDTQWGALFNELNFLPIILPIEIDFREYFKVFEIDGIILTGGNDLNIVNKSNESLKRDIFEKELIKYAIENSIPIFGVCRGMQIVGEYFGANFKKVHNQVGARSILSVNKQSKYFNKLKKLSSVNSFHDYAIDSIPECFLISATDKNGIIKSIEHISHKIFCQMWHSEREEIFDKNQINLIRDFFIN